MDFLWKTLFWKHILKHLISNSKKVYYDGYEYDPASYDIYDDEEPVTSVPETSALYDYEYEQSTDFSFDLLMDVSDLVEESEEEEEDIELDYTADGKWRVHKYSW